MLVGELSEQERRRLHCGTCRIHSASLVRGTTYCQDIRLTAKIDGAVRGWKPFEEASENLSPHTLHSAVLGFITGCQRCQGIIYFWWRDIY